MFVNRSGLKSSTEKTVSQVSGADHHAAAQKRAAVIGLAVAATVSVVSVTWSRLHAEENSLDPIRPLSLQAEGAASDADLLKQASNQYKKGQYEDAKSTLSQINAANLSQSEQKKVAEVNGDVEKALAARQEARSQFAEGQAALEAGNNDAARKLFKNAGDSKFADEATKQKAREQLALSGELEKQRAAEQKADYQQAKKDFEAGNYADAKARFQKLDQAGFKAPMFQTSPTDFLKKIDEKSAVAAETPAAPAEQKTAEAQAETDKNAAAAKAEADKQAAKTQQAQAKEAYKAGVQALQAGDYENARKQFQIADQSGYKSAMFEASAAKMLAEVDKREAESKAAAERQAQKPAEEAAQPDQAKADAQAAEEAARAQRAKAKEAYNTGVSALKSGDYAAARQAFKTADEAGYKPGLFEASAAKMLAEVDQKEAKAKAAAESKPTEQPVAQVPAQQQAPEQTAEQKAEADKKAAEAQAKADKEAAEAKAEADRAAADAQAKADKEAARTQAKAEREAATTRQVAAREQYKAGIAALNSGDFAAARQSFQAADEAGFKPGLFEASAAKMVAEVDKREADAKARADKQAARTAEQSDRDRARAEKQAAEAKVKADKAAAEAQAKADKEAAEAKARAEKEVAATQPSAAAQDAAKAELEATAKMEQIRQQARAYDSQRLVEQARAAQAEGRTATALDLYGRAAETDPSNQAAVDGRNQMLTLQGRAPVTSSLLDEQTKTNRARKEAITYAFNDAIDRARADIAADKYQSAQMQLEAAVVARNQDPNLFTQDEIRALDSTLADTQLQLRQSREAFDRAERQRIADEATAREQARLRQEEVERRHTVAALIADSRRYIQQNKYREALATIDQIIAIDPTNEYATGVRPLVEDRALLQEQRKYREQFRTETVRSFNAAEEILIPYGDYFRYPDNWADISQSRDRFVEEEHGLKQADKAVRAALDKRLPEVRIDGQPFDDVIQFLRDMTGANIFVKWSQLEQAAIDRKTPVTVQLRDVKFSKVLQTVLDSVSPDPNTRLAYTVNEGVITIYVTQDVTAAGTGGVDLVTQVYDITDLMFVIPDLAPGDYGGGNNTGGTGNNTSGTGSSRSSGSTGSSRSSGGSSRSGGGGSSRSGGGSSRSGGSGGGGLFGGSSSSGTSSTSGGSNTESTVAERMDDVTYLISETVAVDTWEENGGRGSIRPSPINQQLIITQTPEVHAQIQALLAQLREAQAIQVTVEARFLTVARNFLEDVGMDFDFSWNNSNPQTFSPIAVQQNSSTFTANPNTGIPGSIAGSTDTSVAPAATLRGTYLDDFQVAFLIRATQAAISQSVVTAPRVTVYNGGSAVVWVYTEQSYVSGLEPEVASGVVGYTPQTDTIQDGVTLFVRANVSADRKYVTLYLQPTLDRLLGIQTFSFQQASTVPSGGVFGGSTIVTQQPTLTIQEPIIQSIGVTTLVSVPDGGTLLLGGQTVAGEIEREAGVPVLSKIPIIKRFFTNRSSAKDETVLLILVKPTIIIQKEQEARQFPLLSSKISGQ